jgi:hypothetical protein
MSHGTSQMERTDTSLFLQTGNAQLLEAAYTRPQVLPRGGGPQGEITEDLHRWFPGGT